MKSGIISIFNGVICMFEVKLSNMVTVKIKENSKEAAALLEYLKSLPFVEIQDKSTNTPQSDQKKLKAIAQKMNKSATKRMLEAYGLAQ